MFDAVSLTLELQVSKVVVVDEFSKEIVDKLDKFKHKIPLIDTEPRYPTETFMIPLKFQFISIPYLLILLELSSFGSFLRYHSC